MRSWCQKNQYPRFSDRKWRSHLAWQDCDCEIVFERRRGNYPEVVGDAKCKFDLGKRGCIPGLLRGLIGMKVGGIRTLKISPRLAYGEAGTKKCVPPNAVLLCAVKQLDVIEIRAKNKPHHPPVKRLRVACPIDSRFCISRR